eukprot:142061-Alexandrium_andersonii.AAC.1
MRVGGQDPPAHQRDPDRQGAPSLSGLRDPRAVGSLRCFVGRRSAVACPAQSARHFVRGRLHGE